MPRIAQLSPDVINKIAAGEVIERPASVVKELLENSVDALATRIEVDIAQGGSELIRVVDDGEGIHPDDLVLAVTSHATSKIRSDADLFRVQTLGFRGEALASIASVSRFRLRTRQADSPTGHEIEVTGGTSAPLSTCGAPYGTQIEVRQLFANTPVRRKFLRTAATEFGHISEQFTRVALAHPRIHAVLRHNNRVVYELPPSDRLIDRLELFYGSDLMENLIQVESEAGDVRLWGYVAHPSQSKSTRKGQYLFLNGRWIQDRALQHALGEAYRGLLMVGRHPITFLFLEVPPDFVDVNVHPTKAEVRFRDGQQLYRQLLSTLRTKFLGMDLDSKVRLPSASPAGETPKSPAADSEQRQNVQRELVSWATTELSRWSPAGGDVQTATRESTATSQEAGSGFPDIAPWSPEPSRAAAPVSPSSEHAPAVTSPQSETIAPAAESTAESPAADVHEAAAMVGADSSAAPAPHAPRVMQIHDCYLVIESREGLTVIDQHALHERVMYEYLRRRVLDGVVESQKMLLPESIDFGAEEAAALLENRELLEQLGFGVEEFGGTTILLNAYPVMLSRADPVQLLRDVADQLVGSGQQPTRRDILDSLLHMMSCKAAIKAGQRLTPQEMESLLAQRHLIDDAHHCPHGRPTALVLSREELDRQFGRLG